MFCSPMDCSTPGFPVITISWCLLHDDGHESMMSSNICCPLFLIFSIFPSIRVFSSESALRIRWAKCFQLKHHSLQWILRVDFLWGWLVWSPCSPSDSQESSPAPQFESIRSLPLSFFMVQLSHQYMTTGKTIALTVWNFVGKVMSLLFNMLSKFIITFLPRSNSSFNLMAAVTVHSDFGTQENKICHCFHFVPICLPWSDGTRCHNLRFLNVEF